MSQQDLFDYVMNTPYNTNPAILKQKIKENSGVSSWNDLKDKPFYTGEKTILERTVDGFEFLEELGIYTVSLSDDFDIPKSGSVSVCWDGEVYNCEVKDFWESEDTYGCNVGNITLPSGNIDYSGEPFLMEIACAKIAGADSYIDVSTTNHGTSHTIGITCEEVHKLDGKYVKGMGYTKMVEEIVDCEGIFGSGLEAFPIFFSGDIVTFKIDGVEFSLVARSLTGDAWPAIVGDNPDALMMGEGQYGWFFMSDVNLGVTFSAIEPHTVSWTIEKHYPLDPKYLPCDLMFKVGCTGNAHPKFGPANMTKPTIVSGSLEAVLEKLANGEVPVVKVQYQAYDVYSGGFTSGYGGEFTCDTNVYGTDVMFAHEIPSLRDKKSVQISMSTDDPSFIEMLVSVYATSPSIVEIS